MPAFSFVHAADFHLDSPFVGLSRLPREQAGIVRELRNATFDALGNVVSLCIRNHVDFLLVAGDVYDGADRSLQAQLRFRDALGSLEQEGIHSYVVHGNHDPLDGWSDALTMPEGAHVFGPSVDSAVFAKDGQRVARIHGISYPTRKIGARFGREMKRQGEEPFQIGLLHCNADGNTQHDPYAPRTVQELVDTGLDYWALGHIHERSVLRQADPFIGYPGNTQGRHIGESGPRGCFLVRVGAEGALEEDPEFVETDVVRWLSSNLDASSLESVDDLVRAADEEIARLAEAGGGRPVIARMTIAGPTPLHAALGRPKTADELLDVIHEGGAANTPFVWVEQLKIRTQPLRDLKSRREGHDFVGDLLRMIQSIRESPEELATLGEPLKEMYEHARAGRVLDMPDESVLREWLDEAETRCVDLLLEGDDA